MARRLRLRRAGRRRRAVLLLSAALVAVACGVTVKTTDALRRFDLSLVDVRFSIRGAEKPPSNVAVIGVDDKTFRETDQQWPFPRSMHGKIIDYLVADGAKVIAYDVQFTESSAARRGGRAQDLALLQSIYDADGRVVLATTEVAPDGTTKVLGSPATQREVDAHPANALFPTDPGGVVRRVPYSVQGLKSFAVVAAEIYRHRTVPRAPFGRSGAWIDYHGPPGTIPYASFSDVLFHKVPRGFFRGKVVVIGSVAPSLQDQSATSTSGNGLQPGPEIQAEAISTVLRGFPLNGTPGWLAVVLLLGFACLPPLLSLRMPPLAAFLMSVLVGGVYLVITQIVFDAGHILPIADQILALAVSAVLTIAVLYLFEAFERRRVRDYFAHFVPEQVVDQVLEQTDGELRLGGTRRECTVLFSDLRGFTTYAESRPPDEVIDVLNQYLTAMTDAILDHGGTLISFMGDGIYAVFGAPLEQPDHRDRALHTARDMLARLGEFNERMLARGMREPFRMGVGINTGQVMCGNVGSERRLEYTAIGDTVNTASRLEGMTKGTGFAVYLAESTWAGLSNRPDELVYVDELSVRGRQKTIRLYGIAQPDVPLDGFDAARSTGSDAVGENIASSNVEPVCGAPTANTVVAVPSPRNDVEM
jgi:adenylate cyclase